MNKSKVIQQIIGQLDHDLHVLFKAARAAHEAATHPENIPDNKYDTLALEASYVAQGQANRAAELRHALEVYKNLPVSIMESDEIRLTALVTIEAEEGFTRTFFVGPLEGGLKVTVDGIDVVVITPTSPLGIELIGKATGDAVKLGSGSTDYEIVAVS